jgi:hypothetical protein
LTHPQPQVRFSALRFLIPWSTQDATLRFLLQDGLERKQMNENRFKQAG